jgi:hypothetical protein
MSTRRLPANDVDRLEGRSMKASSSVPAACYEIRFRSLFGEERGLSFPCDAHGQVEIDLLSERARNDYLYARAVVGREYASPAVCVSAP